MEAFNKALLAKQLWNIISDPHSLLAELVIQKYGRGRINITQILLGDGNSLLKFQGS